MWLLQGNNLLLINKQHLEDPQCESKILISVSSGVTIFFEDLPSWASEIEHFEIFSRPRENQLARRFFVNLI